MHTAAGARRWAWTLAREITIGSHPVPTVLRSGPYRFFFYAMEVPFAENVTVSVDTLCVDLSDGRSISVPLAWYPRLFHATPAERKR